MTEKTTKNSRTRTRDEDEDDYKNLAHVQFAKDAGPVPAATSGVPDEAVGVEQHTPKPGFCQCVHASSLSEVR